MPWEAVYDYVEVYNFNRNTKSFELAWKDDFDGNTIDTSKWSIGNNEGWD